MTKKKPLWKIFPEAHTHRAVVLVLVVLVIFLLLYAAR